MFVVKKNKYIQQLLLEVSALARKQNCRVHFTSFYPDSVDGVGLSQANCMNIVKAG